jgi:hypothetical protein
MTEVSIKQFGLLVAYVLPGFIGLAGLAPILPVISRWLLPDEHVGLDIAPPVYALMAATALGLILTAFRWMVLDRTHAWMGIKRPNWNDRQLSQQLSGFDYLVQNHFRYYEFFGNVLIALVITYILNRVLGTLPFLGLGTDLGMLVIVLVLFAASRDTLSKYYTRTGRLIGQVAEKAEKTNVQR